MTQLEETLILMRFMATIASQFRDCIYDGEVEFDIERQQYVIATSASSCIMYNSDYEFRVHINQLVVAINEDLDINPLALQWYWADDAIRIDRMFPV